LLGLAADIGTSKIAAYLVELATGRTLVKAGTIDSPVTCGGCSQSDSYCVERADGRAVLQAKASDTPQNPIWWAEARKSMRFGELTRTDMLIN
jgi:uncharacterized 2Fe-2S/4Fe-4S cluster protein (DUF4445 family)